MPLGDLTVPCKCCRRNLYQTSKSDSNGHVVTRNAPRKETQDERGFLTKLVLQPEIIDTYGETSGLMSLHYSYIIP